MRSLLLAASFPPALGGIETLLYQVKATDFRILTIPLLTILAVTLLAALPAVIRAVRIDPATILRSE